MTMTATALLLSTYEPSGDALAAVLIDQELQQLPRSRMYALGGPKMEAAGAELIEHTTQRGSMFLETLAQARSHRTRLVRMRSWLESHPIDALIAGDSPAGNWAICRLVRRLQPQAQPGRHDEAGHGHSRHHLYRRDPASTGHHRGRRRAP